MSTSHTRKLRHGWRFLFALFAVLGPVLGSVAPSTAHATSVVCESGNHDANLSPGVTNAVATHEVSTLTTWNCEQLDGVPHFISASSVAEFSAAFSCIGPFSTAPMTWTIVWSDGVDPAKSTFTFTATALPIEGNLVITAPGSITSGRYSGHMATSTFVVGNPAATPGGPCASHKGVTEASGTATLIVL
jgi:hypothetical protein